ncbi:tripartite tricarboxylate transporter substrate binding protein [soil metagenome]
MRNLKRIRLAIGVFALAGLFASGTALAQTAAAAPWPTRPVKIIVTFPPGGTSDLVARLLAPKLSTALGQSVFVENKPGGAGIIGADSVARSPADGYTLVVSTPGSHSIAPTLNRNIKYDAAADFSHIALIGSLPHVLLVNNTFAARNLGEYVAMAKQQPGKIDFGSGGAGSINHVIGELFASRAGISITHIPYKGSAAAISDLRGNTVPSVVDALPANVGSIRNGDLRALAITSAQRSALAPDIPTFKELGYPEVVVENWVGFSGPAKLPDDIVKRLSVETEKALALPDVQEKLREWGMVTTFKGPTEFATFVRADIARWRPVIIASGAQID